MAKITITTTTLATSGLLQMMPVHALDNDPTQIPIQQEATIIQNQVIPLQPILQPIQPATCTTNPGQTTHLWNNPFNWSCGKVPGENDSVLITTDMTVDMAAKSSWLWVNAGVKLTVSQGMDLATTGLTTINGTLANNGTFSATGNVVNTGNLLLNGNTSLYANLNNSGMLDNNATLRVFGSWTQSGTLNAHQSEIKYMGIGNRTLPSATYHHLTIANVSEAISLNGNATVKGNLTFSAGFTSSFKLNGSTLSVEGNILNTGNMGSFIQDTGTLVASGASSQNFNSPQTGLAWGNVTIDKTQGSTVTFSDPTFNGTLNLKSGTLKAPQVFLQGLNKSLLLNGGIFDAQQISFRPLSAGWVTLPAGLYGPTVQLSKYSDNQNYFVAYAPAGDMNLTGGLLISPGILLEVGSNTITIPPTRSLENSGKITFAGGKIIRSSDIVAFTPSSVSAPSSAILEVKDLNRNTDGTIPESINATLIGTQGAGGDTETIPLVETSATSADFKSISLPIVKAGSVIPNNGILEVTGSGNFDFTYIDPQDNADTKTATLSISAGGGGDGLPPTVAITAPANGATVSGASVTLSANANDSAGVAGVTFKVDGVVIGAEDTSFPYTMSWNSSLVMNGNHTISAEARDIFNNKGTANISVIVTNQNQPIVDNVPPSLSLTTPANNASVSGVISVSANASDNIGVVGVKFNLNGVLIGTEKTSAPYTVSWDTKNFPNGIQSLVAEARDAANNITTATINVSITNQQQGNDLSPPIVVFSTPTNGGTVSGSNVNVTVNATDNIGVTNVVFKADGQVIPPSLLIPDGTSWDSTKVSNGSHVLTATAYDAANNSATATSTISVNNNGGDTILEQKEKEIVVLPTVVFTQPKGAGTGEILSGQIVHITAQVSNAAIVAGMTFSIDNIPMGPEDTSDPYTISWDSTKVSNGTHVLKAVARDASNNTGFTTLNIKVNNLNNQQSDSEPPTIFITAPAGNIPNVSGNVTLATTATDNIGVAGVTFSVDNLPIGGEDTDLPYSTVWNSKTVQNGEHTITAVARDAANNTSIKTVKVSVNNQLNLPGDSQPPSVSITKPITGQTASGKSVLVSATANDEDPSGVAGVTFKIDGLILGGEDSVAPYSITWDSTKIANGSHTLTAVARDQANNTSQDSVIVTVSNQNIQQASDIQDPAVTLTSPSEGVTISGSNVGLSASASDNVGIVGVSFEVDGIPIGSEDSTAPYTVTWNSTTVTNGSHLISAVAHDAANNVAISSHTVTVNNQFANNTGNQAPPPQVPSIDLPALQALQASGNAFHKLIKLPSDGNPNTQEDSALYYIGTDNKRHAFPNIQVFNTWYCNFDSVETIVGGALATLPLGANVPYHPGVRMVKFTTDPKVYVVGSNNLLRPIDSEAVATALYGPTWNTFIDDIPDSFYANYSFGSPIVNASDYTVKDAIESVQYPSDSMNIQGYIPAPGPHPFACSNQAAENPKKDSDGDVLYDWYEKQLGTDPTKPDTDGDGLKDGDEARVYKTKPLFKDTDSDGFSDYEEIIHGYNPLGPGKCKNVKCLP